jgi:hypothetical protein
MEFFVSLTFVTGCKMIVTLDRYRVFHKNGPVRFLGPGSKQELVPRSRTGKFLDTLYRVFQKSLCKAPGTRLHW